VHFVGSADDIAASSDDEEDDHDYDPDNDEYWKKVTIFLNKHETVCYQLCEFMYISLD